MNLHKLFRSLNRLTVPDKVLIGTATLFGVSALISIPVLSLRNSNPTVLEESPSNNRTNTSIPLEQESTSSESIPLDTTAPPDSIRFSNESSNIPETDLPNNGDLNSLDTTDTPSGISEPDAANQPLTSTPGSSGAYTSPNTQPLPNTSTLPNSSSTNPYSLSNPNSSSTNRYSTPSFGNNNSLTAPTTTPSTSDYNNSVPTAPIGSSNPVTPTAPSSSSNPFTTTAPSSSSNPVTPTAPIGSSNPFNTTTPSSSSNPFSTTTPNGSTTNPIPNSSPSNSFSNPGSTSPFGSN